MDRKKTFTLLELLIGIFIVGVLVAAAITNFLTAMNNMRRREAVNSIDAIYTAEKNYMFENYNIVNTCVSVADCNTKLRLAIPLTTSCAYAASDTGGGTFCVQADCTATFGKLKKNSSSNSFTFGSLCP
jgi:prepilin-type N-terminal cleavage/methylation domain-containing protein